MTEPYVLVEIADHVAWMTLNEPARLNPVTPQRVTEIASACRTISANDDVRVVVVTGAGRGFCSGADLQATRSDDVRSGPGAGSVIDAGPGVWSLTAMRQPVIAMVNGAAVGFGAEFALSADLRIIGASAKFRFPFSLLGSVTDTGAATWLLPRLVGWSKAAELLYTARMIPAHEAEAIGLANQVLPDAELRDHVSALALELASRSVMSLQVMKRMIFSGLDERKAEHVLGQYFAFAQRDSTADVSGYFAAMRGKGRES